MPVPVPSGGCQTVAEPAFREDLCRVDDVKVLPILCLWARVGHRLWSAFADPILRFRPVLAPIGP
ncbi:hypothetical protein EFN09_06520 [Propionibacterium freudenreichii]|nr:hypothetical protein [Propionibacterium freudenreichii]